jgi:alkylation response protein AidB-like acyl-CoA dehydrogenase
MNVRRLLRKRLADGDIHRRQADDVIDALAGAGFLRLCKPRRFGGYPVEASNVNALAEADGSAACGWGSRHGRVGYQSRFDQLQEEIFGADPDARIAGSACPARPAANKVAWS